MLREGVQKVSPASGGEDAFLRSLGCRLDLHNSTPGSVDHVPEGVPTRVRVFVRLGDLPEVGTKHVFERRTVYDTIC